MINSVGLLIWFHFLVSPSIQQSCREAYQCERLIIDRGDSDAACLGFASCMNAIQIRSGDDVYCEGSYSCYNASSITNDGTSTSP